MESLKLNVLAIPYEFESTNIETLNKLLDSALANRLAKSIGFFLHFERPGQISLTEESLVYKVNLDKSELKCFFLELKERLEPSQSKIDFFVPLGSSGKS